MSSPSTDMAMKNSLDNSVPSGANQGPSKRGMVLPFQPLSLAFDHVNYFVDMPAVSPFSIILHASSNFCYQKIKHMNMNMNRI